MGYIIIAHAHGILAENNNYNTFILTHHLKGLSLSFQKKFTLLDQQN